MTKRLLPEDKKLHIYIDTNVLWNYCKGQANETACLNLLFKKRKEILFTSSFAIGQTMAGIQNSKKKKGLSITDTIEKGTYLCSKITVLSFTENDIWESFNANGDDVEDSMHFAISQKRKCNVVITNDLNGYKKFDIIAVTPDNTNYLKSLLKIK